jgi:tripartite-type tricarboxylate transporter receptor subunit TctC
VIAQVRQGGVRAVASSSSQRLPFLPDVPTLAESGVPGLETFESDSWNGIVAPARTPPAIVERLNAEIRKALALPDVQKRFIELGVQPVSSTPEELKQVFLDDAAKWRAVIEEARIEKQ